MNVETVEICEEPDVREALPAHPDIDGFFTMNQGQLGNPDIRYYASLDNGRIAFIDGGVLMSVEEPPEPSSRDPLALDGAHNTVKKDRNHSENGNGNPRKGCTVRLDFEGARSVVPVGRCRLPGECNFFLGRDPAKWHTGVPSYSEVVYEGLYEGIDLVYRWGLSGVKYEFVVTPGADPGRISVRVRGHDHLTDRGDALVISTAAGDIVDSGLEVFYGDSPLDRIGCSFELRGADSYGFHLLRYDSSRTLVIDPLVYSTYLGGRDWDFCEWVDVDSSGSAYVGGRSRSANYPTTPGSYQTVAKGDYDIIVTKLSPDGSSLEFSTFIGGSTGDSCVELLLGPSGDIFLCGWTCSGDFPTTTGVVQEEYGGGEYDGIVCVLNATGKALILATHLGGNDTDWVTGISTDVDGYIYCGGTTFSEDFYVSPGAYQTENRYRNAFICKLNTDGTAFEYSTFLGGNGHVECLSVVANATGCVHVCGCTYADDFPTTQGAYQTQGTGSVIAYIAQIGPDGTSLVFSTLLGGNREQKATQLAIDDEGDIHVIGYTSSDDFPTTEGAYQRRIASTGDFDVFVSQLNFNGSVLRTSTYIGGIGSDRGNSLALDSDDNVLLCGYTDFRGYPTTPGAAQTTWRGDNEAFMTKLSAEYSKLLYSTLLGGTDSDLGYGIALDARGLPYVAGATHSSDFPTTPGAHKTQASGGDFDGYICKLSFDMEPPVADAGPDQTVDQHETVTFNGTASTDNCDVTNWTWNFIYEGQAVELHGPTAGFTFHIVGEYTVTLTVRDEAWGNDTDSMKVTVRDITPPVPDAGPDRTIRQHDTVDFNGRNSTDNVEIVRWVWTVKYPEHDEDLEGVDVSHTFDMAGVFEVLLNVTDGAGNWATDSANVTVLDTTPPVAIAGPTLFVDQHQTVTFNGSTSRDNVEVTNWTWSFQYGEGTVELYGCIPSFTFDLAGQYTVLLTVRDAAGNEASDPVSVFVRDTEPPVANAGPDSVIYQYQTIVFDGRDSSDNIGIKAYIWSFEYAGSEVLMNGRSPEFMFEEAGLFVVRLRVEDDAGNVGEDTMRVTVKDITLPVADAGRDIHIDQHCEASFNGEGSTDETGIVRWTWEFTCMGEMVILFGAIQTYTFDEAGVFMVNLTVSDAEGNMASDSVDVFVRDITPPSANAGSNQTVDQHATVVLDGSASTDNVGVDSWEWTFEHGDRQVTLSGEVSSFVFDFPGEYEVILTVTDLVGNSASGSVTVSVRDTTKPVPAPLHDIDARIGERVRFDGSASTDNVGVTRWKWTFREEGKLIELEGESVEFIFENAGEYKVTLMVYDAAGNAASETFTVTVGGMSWIWWFLPSVVLVVVVLTMAVRKRRLTRNQEDNK